MENRLKSKEGINYAEFSYQTFQAYDWFHLLDNHNCTIQVLNQFFYIFICYYRFLDFFKECLLFLYNPDRWK